MDVVFYASTPNRMLSVTAFQWVTSKFDVVSAFGVWLSFASFSFQLHSYLTGERALTSSSFFVPTGPMMRSLSGSMEKLLPKTLVEKLRRRKLFVHTYEEQQCRGEYFRMV